MNGEPEHEPPRYDPDIDAFASYGHAWAALRYSFIELLLIGAIWLAFAAFTAALHRLFPPLAVAYHALVLAPLAYGGLYAYLRAVRGERPRPIDIFAAFGEQYWPCVLANAIAHVLIGFGFALLLIPGVIALVRLSFLPFLVMDEQLDALEAIRESWARTRGHGGQIFTVWLLAIPIALGGILLFGVGIVPAGMWIHLAFATLYAQVTAAESA
jgi:hypothetical protein